MAANLELVIKAVDQASKNLKEIEKSAGGLGKTMGTVLKVGAIAGAAGIGAAVFAGVKFAQMAAKEEVGIKRLATAIDAAGGSWAKQGAEVEKIIRQREKLAFADDELRDSLSILVSQTGDVDEALRRQTVAMDFARGANIDLNMASKLLGKVTDENVNVLRRYGITVEEGADATDVLAEVQRRFSGQSAAFADTAVGKWQRFNNTIANIKEAIGAALLPVMLGAIDALTRFADSVLPKVEQGVGFLSEKVSNFADQVIPTLKEQITGLGEGMKGVVTSDTFKAFLDGIGDGLENIQGLAISAKDAIVNAFRIIGTYVGKVPGLEKFTKDVEGVGDPANQAKVRTTGKVFAEAAAGILAFSVAASVLDTSVNIIMNTVSGIGSVIMSIAVLPLSIGLVLGALIALGIAIVLIEKKTKFFSQDLLPTIQKLAAWFQREILPTLQEIATFMAGEFAAAWGQLQQTIEGMEPVWDQFKQIAMALIPVLQSVVEWIGKHPAVIAILVGALTGLLVVLFPIPAAILGIIAVGTLLLAHWDDIRNKTSQLVADFQEKFPVLVQIIEFVFGSIKARVEFWINTVRSIVQIVMALIHGDFGGAWQGIKNLVNGFLNLIKADVENVLRLIVGIVKSVLPDDLLAKPFNKARDSVKWLIDKINDLIDAIKRLPSMPDITPGFSVPGIPGLQHGGIVTRPTLALIGEAGPEAIVPLSGSRDIGIDYDRLAEAVVRAFGSVSVQMDGQDVGRIVSGWQGRQANLYSRGG